MDSCDRIWSIGVKFIFFLHVPAAMKVEAYVTILGLGFRRELTPPRQLLCWFVDTVTPMPGTYIGFISVSVLS